MKMNKQDLMDMHAIQALTDADMQKVNQAILAQINSDVPMVNQLGFYIVQGGGKRIRPLIAVLAARALGYPGRPQIPPGDIWPSDRQWCRPPRFCRRR